MRLVLASIAAFAIAGPAVAQDGQAAFDSQCKSCHTVTGVSSPAGPTLKGVVGRKIASAPGFNYSAGLKKKTGTWTAAELDAFLTNPSGYAPGTRMFNKVGDARTRAAIVGYLATVK